MPNPVTHINFLKQIIKDNKSIFSKLDKEQLYNGAIAPDLYYYIPIKKSLITGKNLSDFWHGHNDNNIIGLKFGLDLIKYSKDRNELSFAIGFYSHFILDMFVHEYLRSIKQLHNINHLIIENFLDSEYNDYVTLIKFPKRLLKEVFKEEHPKFRKQYALQIDLNFLTPYLYKIYNFFNHFIIRRKYISKRNTKRLMIWDLVLWGAYYKPIKRIGFKGLGKLIYPDYALKEKHILKIKIEMEKAKIDFLKGIKKI